MTSFWCLYRYLWTGFTCCSVVPIVDFEQVNVGRVMPHVFPEAFCFVWQNQCFYQVLSFCWANSKGDFWGNLRLAHLWPMFPFYTPGNTRRAQKVSKIAQKQGFWRFDKILIYLYVVILLEYERTNDVLIFFKNHMAWKNLVLKFGPKTFRPIRMQDSLNCNIW